MSDKLITELRRYRIIEDKHLALLRRWFERLLEIDSEFLTEPDLKYGKYLIGESDDLAYLQQYYAQKRAGEIDD